jgi:site-specific DNA recombinase
VYLREDALLPALDRWLGRYFAPHRRADTIATIVAAQGEIREDHTVHMARETIAECDRKLARYRAALEAMDENTDPSIVAGWIAEAQKQRAAAEAKLHQPQRTTHMSQQQITDLVAELGDHTQAIATADPTCKADLYGRLGLYLTYHPAKPIRCGPRLASTRTV